ncbi:MAG: FHA domain-containing protein [Bacteroidetes bacterium]|nr:FHA domain-containing protein [Bacteroidota bacterium]
MATRETEHKENNQFSKSIGAGVKSIFGGGGRTYFILEHKVTSDRYRAGQIQEIIIDYIELGRDPKCQVQFGDMFPTVSRRHAAIAREGNNWVLKQLSASNPTLINGRPIKNQWFLQNGDEIQLSMEGPKIGFLVPANPGVKSIGLSRRLSLFRQQALKPYKKAIMALSAVFLLGMLIAGYFLYQGQTQIKDLVAKNKELFETAKNFKGDVDSLQRQVKKSDDARRRLESQMAQLAKSASSGPAGGTTGNSVPSSMNMNSLFPDVYFMFVDKLVAEYNGKKKEIDYKWSGTGFLLNDGRFITARHVVEPWFFINSEDETGLLLNSVASNGGSVTAFITAYSPNGSTISFTTSNFKCNRFADEIKTETDEDGSPVLFRVAHLSADDWAFTNAGKQGGISAYSDISAILKQQQKLHILGYPLGLGASSPTNISPIYGSCIVSSTQLQNGYILVTDRNFEHGNSGGPVFVFNEAEAKYYAIGIVSAGAGENTGMIVPLSAIQQ